MTRLPRVLAALLAGLLTAALCGCGSTTLHLVDLSSSGDGTTPAFTAHNGWQLEYSWDCSNQAARGVKTGGSFSYQLYNADDDTLSAQKAELNRKGDNGNGTVGYSQPGPYYVQVSSPCNWRVQVVSHT